MLLSRRTRALGALAVAILSGEVAGRWLVAQLAFGVAEPDRIHAGFDIWPALVVASKVGLALLLARVAWQLVHARRLARNCERLTGGERARLHRPSPSLSLSPRCWLASFLAMSALYLIPTSSYEIQNGCWPLVSPLVHTQALPIFAVLAVVVAVAWRTISRWLRALEKYTAQLQLTRIAARVVEVRRGAGSDLAPLRLFGVSLQTRPPPLLG